MAMLGNTFHWIDLAADPQIQFNNAFCSSILHIPRPSFMDEGALNMSFKKALIYRDAL